MTNRDDELLVECTDVVVQFSSGRSDPVRAVDGVSLRLHENEILGLIGESGSGKSTLARTILGLQHPQSGRVSIGGRPVHGPGQAAALTMSELRQAVFQDSQAALNPRMRVADSIREPMQLLRKLDKRSSMARVTELLGRVKLSTDYADRYPHQVSGGQRQRVNIARALSVDPRVLICDEAVSALDVSLRAGILNTLMEMQSEARLAVLFISHDLDVVAHISDRVAVMYLGRIVEEGPTHDVINNPRHPYTMSLLASQPSHRSKFGTSYDQYLAEGEIPSPRNPPSGCRYRTRCAFAQATCSSEVPAMSVSPSAGQAAACHFAGEIEFVPARSTHDEPEEGAR